MHFPHMACCVSSSIHQAVLFHCHPTNTLIADINAVTHTSMDVLNLHLILNSGGVGGGVPPEESEGSLYTLDVFIVFLFWCWFSRL